MTRRLLTLALAGLLAVAFGAVQVRAEDKKPEPAKPAKKPEAKPVEKTPEAAKPTDQKPADKPKPTGDKKPGEDHGMPGMDPEMMKKMMEAGMPGPHHKHLQQLVGKWTYTAKFWMAPDAPPMEIPGTSENKMILDGRYLQQEVASAGMGGPDSQPFHGLGLIGYDNLQKKYISIWMDNESTTMMIAEGTCSEDGKTMTSTGQYTDPMTDGKVKKTRTVMKVIDADSHSFEMFEAGPDGKEFKTAEIMYKRAK